MAEYKNYPHDEHIEHMSIIMHETDVNMFLVQFFVLFTAFLLASKRNELTTFTGIFILLFPYAYIVYVIVDALIHF